VKSLTRSPGRPLVRLALEPRSFGFETVSGGVSKYRCFRASYAGLVNIRFTEPSTSNRVISPAPAHRGFDPNAAVEANHRAFKIRAQTLLRHPKSCDERDFDR
jgi:hypothetical protein